jgi:hypothetical protein
MDEQTRTEMPKSEALQALEKNLGNIGRLLELMTRSVRHIVASEALDKLKELKEATARLRDNPEELLAVQSTLLDAWHESMLKESSQFLSFLSDWMLVMMVSFAEAYLEDVLTVLVGPNPANRILGSGNPERWIESLQSLGADGYRAGLGADMKKVWKKRHTIVHSRETRQYMTLSDGQRALNVIYSFLTPTDRVVVNFLSSRPLSRKRSPVT